MRRLFVSVFSVVVLGAMAVPAAFAGNPHFVFVDVSKSGNTLTATGKEAGLGDEPKVRIALSATAECINPGNNNPKASNKESVSTAGDFPVQNGKAEFSLTLTATFQPDCSPPMSVVFSEIEVTDVTSGISYSYP